MVHGEGNLGSEVLTGFVYYTLLSLELMPWTGNPIAAGQLFDVDMRWDESRYWKGKNWMDSWMDISFEGKAMETRRQKGRESTKGR